MSARPPHSRLSELRGQPARSSSARRSERTIAATQLPIPWAQPSPEATAVPDALRRRQAAARRLPPLTHSGKRDPIAPTRQQTLLEVVVGSRTVWFYGVSRRQFITLCRRAGVTRWMKDNRTFCVRREDADAAEMIAVADHGLGWRTTVRNDDR